MVTKREWLIEQGLAKAGRGRFSLPAKEALAEAIADGVVFDDPIAVVSPKAKKVAKIVTADLSIDQLKAMLAALQEQENATKQAPLSLEKPTKLEDGRPVIEPGGDGVFVSKPHPKIRNNKSLFGYTREGNKVNWSTCARCAEHIQYCDCKSGPKPPRIVETLDEEAMALVG